MSRFVILCTFILPLSPVAAASPPQNWGYAQLRDDVSLAALLGQPVESMLNRPMGVLRDVLVDKDGMFEAAVVEFEEGIGTSGVAVGVFEWSDVVLKPAELTSMVSVGYEDERRGEFDATGTPATRILGRTVALRDNASFGRVADILVDPDDEQASALLVEADGRQFALPLEASGPWSESAEFKVDMTEEAVLALGEFELKPR